MPPGPPWRIGADGFHGSGWGETMEGDARRARSPVRRRRLVSTGPDALSYEVDPESCESEAEKPETLA